MRPLPLGDSPAAGYVVDTSSVLAVEPTFGEDAPMVWAGLNTLIDQGRLKTVAQVLTEVERHDELAHAKLRSLPRQQLVIPETADLLLLAAAIAEQFPRLAGVGNPKDKADPFVVAAALAFGWTAVCNEARGPDPRQRKIWTACASYSVHCVNIVELVQQEHLL